MQITFNIPSISDVFKKKENIIDKIEANVPAHTPDIANLERLNTTWLFNYSGHAFLKSKIPQKHLDISGVAAYTDDKDLILWRKNLGTLTFPIAMSYGTVPEKSYLKKIRNGEGLLYPPGRIRGSLCLIQYPGNYFPDLDNEALNTIYFTRKRVKVMVPYHFWDKHYGMLPSLTQVHAWMYVGIPEYWEDQIERSEVEYKTLVQPSRTYHARNKLIGNYYTFSDLECKGDPFDVVSTGVAPVKSITASERRKNLIKLNQERNNWNVQSSSKSSALSKLSIF